MSRLLSPGNIIIYDEPVKKYDLLSNLTVAALQEEDINFRLSCLGSIFEREDQGSTFFNEGVAFPHARIEGLKGSVVALGITRRGVSDVTTEKPIELVFLILSPDEDPARQIQILALASRAAKDRQLVEGIRKAPTPGEVFAAIREWEIGQEAAE